MKTLKKKRPPSTKISSAKPSRDSRPSYLCEAEIVAGLLPLAQAELRHRFGQQVIFVKGQQPDRFLFHFSGNLRSLLTVRQIHALYLTRVYAIPRPKALLGHQHCQQLLRDIQTVRALHPKAAFQTFRLSAAGETSSVFTRLKEVISAETGLAPASDKADLLLRVRPAAKNVQASAKAQVSAKQRLGWEVLTRLSPRPLTTRPWRVRDYPGALNATIAAAMVHQLQPRPQDHFLNLMCGSGTLLIERLQILRADVTLGCDWSQTALRAAEANLAAAHLSVPLLQADVTNLPLPDQSFNTLCADLPWGHLVGSHTKNLILYPQMLREATRLATSKATLALISHDIRLLEQSLAHFTDQWQMQHVLKLSQESWHPSLYVLRKH